MIPSLIAIKGEPWEVLPPGIHPATLVEIEAVFATTPHRKWLFEGFCRATANLKAAGCRLVYLDGSFVTSKVRPGDFDAAWDPFGVDCSKVDPVLLDYKNKREAQKAKYGGEYFVSISDAIPNGGINFVSFFQKLRGSNTNKGILSIALGGVV